MHISGHKILIAKGKINIFFGWSIFVNDLYIFLMCIDVRCYYCILRSVHFVVDDRIIIENLKSIGVFDFLACCRLSEGNRKKISNKKVIEQKKQNRSKSRKKKVRYGLLCSSVDIVVVVVVIVVDSHINKLLESFNRKFLFLRSNTHFSHWSLPTDKLLNL